MPVGGLELVEVEAAAAVLAHRLHPDALRVGVVALADPVRVEARH
jgi:hypothetical protein